MTSPHTHPIPLLSLRTGRITLLGSEAVPSAIRKYPHDGPVAISLLGLASDEQADRQHHGGPDKAMHHYPAEHYPLWRAELPDCASRFEVGGFGENLSTLGLNENDVCVGDVFRLGSAVIQVSQGRSPCRKLEIVFDVPDMVRQVHETGRTGWYYRVLSPGEVTAEDGLILEERPHRDWPVARLFTTLFQPGVDTAALRELAELPVLAGNWRQRARQRLKAM
jgi:MOSC domain-containing protein YiiM